MVRWDIHWKFKLVTIIWWKINDRVCEIWPNQYRKLETERVSYSDEITKSAKWQAANIIGFPIQFTRNVIHLWWQVIVENIIDLGFHISIYYGIILEGGNTRPIRAIYSLFYAFLISNGLTKYNISVRRSR